MLDFINMSEANELDENSKFKEELNRTRAELTILYEISNALRTTLNLDEILYIILTGVTAHLGLAFNRAMLFLVNEHEEAIEGRMGVGPDTGEEANKIWTKIQNDQMDLEDLTSAYKTSSKVSESKFDRQVKSFKIPLKRENPDLLSIAALDGMPLHITKDVAHKHQTDPLFQIMKTEELVIVPLKAKDKVNGIVVADNIFTQKPISKDDMRMLIMLSNQAGLAIENSQLYERTLIKSHSDSLTNLWNHGYFQYQLQHEFKKTKELNLPLSLVFIDIDNFKKYNDLFGHQAGDEILKEIAGILQDYSRKMDWGCRYGGEEFAIILPQTSKKDAYAIAERLREKIQNHRFNHYEEMSEKKLSVSIGVATYPQDANDKSELILAADKFLYQAKHQGKNQTCC